MKFHAAMVLSAFVLAAGCTSAPEPLMSASLEKPSLERKADKDIRRGEKLLAEGRSDLDRQEEKARKARAELRKAEDRIDDAKSDIRKGERLVEEAQQVQQALSSQAAAPTSPVETDL
jgi:chromosome segregation ATPase